VKDEEGDERRLSGRGTLMWEIGLRKINSRREPARAHLPGATFPKPPPKAAVIDSENRKESGLPYSLDSRPESHIIINRFIMQTSLWKGKISWSSRSRRP
jgi:hypothetical protein